MEERIGFKNRAGFRKWLNAHHGQDSPIWIEFYKDGTQSVSYEEALEESLCFGWIDSMVRRIDERVYVQKFSRRKKNSRWSERNREIAEGLVQKGLMTAYGLEFINEAKENGRWYEKNNREELEDTAGFRKIIGYDKNLARMYDGFTESLKKHYARYYFDARQESTRKKRLEKIIEYMKDRKRVI